MKFESLYANVLTFSADMKGKYYTKSILRFCFLESWFTMLYIQFSSSRAILKLYMSINRPCCERCCNIYSDSYIMYLDILDEMQSGICNINVSGLASHLSRYHNVASLIFFFATNSLMVIFLMILVIWYLDFKNLMAVLA